MGVRCTTNVSAPTRPTMAPETVAFNPWMSDTTVTIEVTATMLPSTVRNDRSLFAQMECSAIQIDSKIGPTIYPCRRRMTTHCSSP